MHPDAAGAIPADAGRVAAGAIPADAAGTIPADAGRVVAERMAEAARAVLEGLDGEQRARVGWGWDDAESQAERMRWFYTPTEHGGVPVGEMSPGQYGRTMTLIASGLSEAAYVTVSTIMGLENVLDRTEGFPGSRFGRERGRDPGMYYLRVFGRPGSSCWGWRLGGHHVSLNNLVVDGALRSITPCFLGADPASSPLLGGRLLRPLGGVEDLARELVRSLDARRRGRAVLTPHAPTDIIGANRPRVAPGDRLIPLPDIWRTPFPPEERERGLKGHQEAERVLGITADDHDVLALPAAPKGLPAAELDDGQRDLLRALLDTYLGRAPDEVRERLAARYADDWLDGVHVAWAGSLEPGEPHYYRLHGHRLLVEYDNTQRQVNHAHSVWRDPEGDFGADILAEHRAAHHL